jgi:hypothetical protein
VVAERLLVRIDAVQPLFRGGSAAVVFQGTATGLTTGVSARVELGGRLVSFRIEKGRLVAGAEVIHFKALDTSLGGAGSALLERLLRDSLAELSRSLPALEIPVHLEQSIEIAGLAEGVVVAQPGVLLFQMTLTDVIPVDERLWILLEAKAGPWRRNPGGKKDE